MRIYAIAAVTALSLVAGSCADAPTRPQPDGIVPEQAPLMKKGKAAKDARLLSNMQVDFPIQGGGTFSGKLTITRFDIDPETRQLYIDGLLSGRAMKADGGIMKTADGHPAVIPAGQPVTITNVPVTLRGEDATSAIVRPAQGSCDILFLDLGPIHLDLLGLVLDVSQIVIDLNAVTGPGNLLGNLLCALLGLLDAAAIIGLIQDLLDAINALLAGLGGGTPAV